jgi:hypothetical protein
MCRHYYSEHIQFVPLEEETPQTREIAPTREIPPTRIYPRPLLSELGAGAPPITEANPRIKGHGEMLLHEIVKLVFPGGKEVKNQEELSLRLHLVVGLLCKYGYGPNQYRI